MTTSRRWFLAVIWGMAAGSLGAQAHPKELTWALAEWEGVSEWQVRLPQLLAREWGSLPEHRLTEHEQKSLRQRFLDETLRGLDQQSSRLILALDRKRLAGPLPATEPAATEKTLKDLESKAAEAREGRVQGAAAPATLPLRPVWPKGQDNFPWKATDRRDLLTRSQAAYVVTGTVRLVGRYLDVGVELYSEWEGRVLASWTGQLAPEEAPQRMAEASDRLRSALLGRPWAGLVVSAEAPGTKVEVADRWRTLPWSSDDQEPGPLVMKVRHPTGDEAELQVELAAETRTTVVIPAGSRTPEPILLETEPPGVSLYLDSRYLGPSPQTVDRPLTTARVRAQAPGWETLAWEIGPDSPAVSRGVLLPPQPARSVADAKDRFYWSLAGFSFSLTTSAFLGAWTSEQVLLANAYAEALAAPGYYAAVDRYNVIRASYAASIVLTSAVFVWMMFELGDYLAAAQASLP